MTGQYISLLVTRRHFLKEVGARREAETTSSCLGPPTVKREPDEFKSNHRFLNQNKGTQDSENNITVFSLFGVLFLSLKKKQTNSSPLLMSLHAAYL